MGREPSQAVCALLLMLAFSCAHENRSCGKCGDASGSAPAEQEARFSLTWIHGYGAWRSRTASQAVLMLLHARVAMMSREFDPAIRELTRVQCLGAPPEVLAKIEGERIERIYPMHLLAFCTHMLCGGCITLWRSIVTAPAFPQLPDFDRPLPSENVMIK
jgi:hypothetical protein